MTAAPDPRTAPAAVPAAGSSLPGRADAGTPPCIGVPAPDPPPALAPPGRAGDHAPAGAGPDADDAAPAGYHGADARARIAHAQAAWNAAKRRGRTRRAAKATGPGMIRKPPPETPGGAA